MRREDIMRLFRAVLFLFVSIVIMLVGMLPGNFTQGSFQVSSLFFAWTAAFILRRPGSARTAVIIIATVLYAILNDEGIALGALTYLLFSLFLHETRESFANQSFSVELLSMTLLFFVFQLFKNLILQLFFTYHFTLWTLLKFSLAFAFSYAVSAMLISGVIGRKKFDTVRAL